MRLPLLPAAFVATALLLLLCCSCTADARAVHSLPRSRSSGARGSLFLNGPPSRHETGRNRHDHHRTAQEAVPAGTPLAAAGDTCNFNNVQGTCMPTSACAARGGNSTSMVGALLCAGADNWCCITQAEPTPGCGSSALLRASTWAAAQLSYCQSPNGKPDPLSICSPICERASNPVWDAYRSDCSGLVSYSYGFPPPGRITLDFAPYNTDVSFVLPGGAADLQPGDAINSIPREHIMLFHSWGNANKTYATFYEEPTCVGTAPWARMTYTDVTINEKDGTITLACNGMTFAPIRMYSNKNVC